MRLPVLARLVLLSLGFALAGGCVSGPYGGNMFLTWTFAGQPCSQVPQVATVTVSIPSDPTPIVPDTFACSAGTPPGALAIYNFAPGSYVVNLVAQNASGTVLYSGSATVFINGDAYATIDLQPVNVVGSLSWNFAAAIGTPPPCTGLHDPDPDRMDSVALYVDGDTTAAAIYDCIDGVAPAQVAAPALTPGNHTVQLVAYQDGVADAFAQTDPVVVDLATPQTLTQSWLVGGVGVVWTYPSANACTLVGVTSVTASFSGPGGYALTFPCDTAVAPFKGLPARQGGQDYPLGVVAYGAPPGSPVIYQGAVPAVTIQPGVFYDGTTNTVVTVPLN
jgi:hypothetical protein